MGCVYMATNIENGKIYVGKTVCSLEKRKREHKSGGKKGGTMAFSRAISKHGFKSFSWSILFESNSNEELMAKEIEMIRRLGSNGPKGYNTTSGGERGWTVTKDHAESISNRMRIAMTDDRRRNFLADWSRHNGDRISEIARNRYMDKEYKSRHSDIIRSVCSTDSWSSSHKIGTLKRSRRVECVTTGQFFVSISEACRYFNISSGSLIKNSKKYNGVAYGKKWIFHDPSELTDSDNVIYTDAGGKEWTLNNLIRSLKK